MSKNREVVERSMSIKKSWVAILLLCTFVLFGKPSLSVHASSLEIINDITESVTGNHSPYAGAKDKTIIDEANVEMISEEESFGVSLYASDTIAEDCNGESIDSEVEVEEGVFNHFSRDACSIENMADGTGGVLSNPDDVIAYGKCGQNLDWALDVEGTLVIIGFGAMDDFLPDGAPWKEHREQITSVEFSNQLTSIGNYSFEWCECMTTLYIPEGVTSIGEGAFSGCRSITNVYIPKSVIKIKTRAFGGCENLSSVEIPSDLRTLGEAAFGGCNELKSISIPDTVISIEDDTFRGCSGLLNVSIPDSITRIGSGVFFGCSDLTSISIPNSVTSIGGDAFCGCCSLKTINVPNGITIINSGTFFGCSGLETIVLPRSVDYIGDYAFYDCSGLLRVDLPDQISFIGSNAFGNCTRIDIIKMPSNLNYIGGSAFEGCTSLRTIAIPNEVTFIQAHTFAECSSLINIDLPDNLEGLDSFSFRGCTSIESINLPQGVRFIENYAFSDCTNLKQVTGSSIVTTIGESAFSNCENLETIISCVNVDSIGAYAFDGCEKLKSIVLSPSVSIIPTGAFRDCSDDLIVEYYGPKERWEETSIWGYNEPLEKAKKTFHGTKPLSLISVCFDYLVELIGYDYYTGLAPTPLPVVYDGQRQLQLGLDYTVSYRNNERAGRAYAVITGEGEYSGTVFLPFYIRFADVPNRHSYSKQVKWAVDNGIAVGYSGDKTGYFGVSDNITRGQVMMFLWRAAGKPEPKKTTQTFKDVPTTHAFYKAIQWGSEQVITTGYSNGKFGVNDPCTRGQIVTFMWRYAKKFKDAGNPKGTKQTFPDVPTSHSFYKAVQWASENGVTTGYSNGKFGVTDKCTRGQCVTFLYRALGK